MKTTNPSRRDVAITLAGGGNRAFYQLGLLEPWWPQLAPRVGSLAACSAGACTALLLLTGRAAPAFEYWHQRRAHVRKNLEWWRLFRGERPAPHYPIYRDTLHFALADGGFERLRAMPFPIKVLVAVPPHGLPVPLAVPIGLTAYSIERWLNPGRLHPGIGRRLGFEPWAIDLRECDSIDEMVAVVLASSATPPFTPVGSLGGRAVLDGGLVDNAPAFVAEGSAEIRRHLVVLTRPYPATSVGRQRGRWYLCPSRPVPADRWDYTRPERITQTIALGADDARARRADFETWLTEGD
jgi:predicted acylesterase/phospholipase RssA